jgi:hypothetical protein
MRTTNRPTFTGILCCAGVLLCIFAICATVIKWIGNNNMKVVGKWIERVNIVESFYTTDRYGRPEYYLMWENDKYADVMGVCSSCYMKYRDAAQMPIKVTELESINTHGYNFELHNHYNYERTDK